MNAAQTDITNEIAAAAGRFQQQRTGHTPRSVTAVLSEDMLVITLRGALSPAEEALAQSDAGATRVREYHRQLFATSSDHLRQEIQRISGREILEASAEVQPATGTVVHAFTTGAMVQVFQFAERRTPDAGIKLPFPTPERSPQ